MTTFAENNIVYPDTQQNVETPPESLLLNGFIPKQVGTRGQPLSANWLNWLFRELFRASNRDRVSDGSGLGTLTGNDANTIITLYALQKGDPTKFIHAVGYKNGDGTPAFNVLSNSNLTIGAVTFRNTPIIGANADEIIQYLHVQKA